RKEGMLILTGEIGTGKTTVCRSVLERLDMTCFTSLLLNPFLSVEEMLREILLDFGVVSREAVRNGRISAATKHDLVSTLHEFLVSLIPIGGSGVLIIDEAQHLSPQVLEEIRVLSNLETNHTKLLQIVLVGQVNLLDVLATPDVRQLDQRVSLRAVLQPLTRTDVEAYIEHRISIAHGSASVSFDAEALDTIYATTQGVPRVINLVCDRALMLGARFGLRVITADVIIESADALGLQVPRAQAPFWAGPGMRWALMALAILALLGAGLL